MRQGAKRESATDLRNARPFRAGDLPPTAFAPLQVTTSGLDPEVVLLNGNVWRGELRSGLRLQATATRCVQSFETEAVLEPGLYCVLHLDGHGLVEAQAKGHKVSFAPLPGREPRPEGFLFNVVSPGTLTRASLHGQHTRKLTVTIPVSWLDRIGSKLEQSIAAFCATDLAMRRWQPSPRLGEAAAKLLRAPSWPVGLLPVVTIEALALQIVEHALRNLTLRLSEGLNECEVSEAARLQAIVEAHLTRPLPLEDLARQAGMSKHRANSVFGRAHGQSIAAYVRSRRMEKAKEGIEHTLLPIAQIGYLAGFSSAANFATAFRRRFGVSPKELRGG